MNSLDILASEIQAYRDKPPVEEIRRAVVAEITHLKKLDNSIKDLYEYFAVDAAKEAYKNDFDDVESVADVVFKEFHYNSELGLAGKVRSGGYKKSLGRFIMNLISDNDKLRTELEQTTIELERKSNLLDMIKDGKVKFSDIDENDE